MKKIICTILLAAFLISVSGQNRASWMKEAKWGVMLHYTTAMLATDQKIDAESVNVEKWKALIEDFNCEKLAKQLSDAGAGYLIITVRHSSDGFILSPNSMYEHYMVGEAPGRCSDRDLVEDLYHALDKYDIRLMTYISSHFTKGEDETKAFAFDRDDPRKAEAYLRWQEVIREYSMRWGDKVSGWWIDGCYLPNTQFRHPDIPNFASMAAAMRAGNPNSIVAFNPGRFPRIMSITPYEDYTAGEINEPGGILFKHTYDQTIDGKQIHILTYMGRKWGIGDPRFTDEELIRHSRRVNKEGGAITWDVPPLADGTISDDFMSQLKALGEALGTVE